MLPILQRKALKMRVAHKENKREGQRRLVMKSDSTVAYFTSVAIDVVTTHLRPREGQQGGGAD